MLHYIILYIYNYIHQKWVKNIVPSWGFLAMDSEKLDQLQCKQDRSSANSHIWIHVTYVVDLQVYSNDIFMIYKYIYIYIYMIWYIYIHHWNYSEIGINKYPYGYAIYLYSSQLCHTMDIPTSSVFGFQIHRVVSLSKKPATGWIQRRWTYGENMIKT